MCKSWCELVLGIIIVVFAVLSSGWAKWVVFVAGIALVVHSFSCKSCFECNCKDSAPVKTRAARKK